jgi:hypothetical protein
MKKTYMFLSKGDGGRKTVHDDRRCLPELIHARDKLLKLYHVKVEQIGRVSCANSILKCKPAKTRQDRSISLFLLLGYHYYTYTTLWSFMYMRKFACV